MSEARDARHHDPDAVDLLVVGGGINGAGIARDAAGRGLSVLLCEKDDLAAHTSSASTKLIHGGLRYLEQYEFRLVAKALAERETLLRLAPHIIWPLRFVLPHQSHLRPAWMIRLGLLLYDRIGARDRVLQSSRRLDLTRDPAGEPLRADLRRGFSYADAWVQDARLVVLNAVDAARRGARILTRTRCTKIAVEDGCWSATLEGEGGHQHIRARAVVNATGPWAGEFIRAVGGFAHRRKLRLIKGSHIVVRRRFEHDSAYIFQLEDRRIVFAIPYERAFTLIGTTDVEAGPECLQAPRISDDEVRYLCEAVNGYFRAPLRPQDVVWSYSGVRPLFGEPGKPASEVSRDYHLELDDSHDAPLLNVFGGKITTYRRLAEQAVDRLASSLGNRAGAWTASGEVLPGGDFRDPEALADALCGSRPWLPPAMAQRLVRHYGTLASQLLGSAASLDDLGTHFGADLYQAELDYLMRNEWARTAADVLWRRTKLGLHLDAAARERVAAHLQARHRAA